MYSTVATIGLNGIEPYLISVEIDTAKALPAFEIVGLPDVVVKESRDRIKSAIKNCGFEFPKGRVLVNLAPAGTKKASTAYDLPILMGILKVCGYIEEDLSTYAFLGEISLNGEIRPLNGVLPMLLEAKKLGVTKGFIPLDNAQEGKVIEGIPVYAVKDVNELVNFFANKGKLPLSTEIKSETVVNHHLFDMCDVKGQQQAKRALEIAAAGGHNMLLIGPPGTGKSMLAKRIPSILPPLSYNESIETTKIHSVAGVLNKGQGLLTYRPFRAPHHTVSPAGLSGGGTVPKPGELSLAHNGVLFLDELPEFSRIAMEVLRQPLEDGAVTISRANARITYPASVMLIAAMNPCPCGYFGHPVKECICSKGAAAKYLNKVSGPLLDRLDLHIEVSPVDYTKLSSNEKQETSAEIRERVIKARNLQLEKYKSMDFSCNAKISSAKLHDICVMTDDARKLLGVAFDKIGLSARAYDRILKVARTIADLDNKEIIGTEHIGEAIQYRNLDRKYWNK